MRQTLASESLREVCAHNNHRAKLPNQGSEMKMAYNVFKTEQFAKAG